MKKRIKTLITLLCALCVSALATGILASCGSSEESSGSSSNFLPRIGF